jgi:hypothetical protein
MRTYPDAIIGTVAPENEHAYKNERACKRQAHERRGAAGKPCDVLVKKAPLRGLTPEIREIASGTAERPMVVQGGKSRKARMKCIALSGRSDPLRPFPHVSMKILPLIFTPVNNAG